MAPNMQLSFQAIAMHSASSTTPAELASAPIHLMSVQRGVFEPAPFLVLPAAVTKSIVQANSRLRITDMPQELMDMITENLSARDVGSLRQTCRTLEAKSQDRFAQRTFTEVSIWLTREHLASLAVALKNVLYASQVKALRVYSHMREQPLQDAEQAVLRTELTRVLDKMPHIALITVIGEFFEGCRFICLPDAQLSYNGINCHLPIVLNAIKHVSKLVSTFKLENLTSRHHFRHDATGNSKFAAITMLNVECGRLLQNIGQAFVPGGCGQPARFADQFKQLTKLSFSGGGHQVQGCEMAFMLNEVRLPKLVTISLSNSSFYHSDILNFCLHHQETLEEIELTRMTLRSCHFGIMIRDIVEVDNDWDGEKYDLKKLKSIRLQSVCEARHFVDNLGTHEDMHKAVIVGAMNATCSGWWKKEVLVVPGRGNPNFQEFFKDGRTLDRETLTNGCHQGYHASGLLWEDDYSPFRGECEEVSQEFDNDDETYEEEPTGIPGTTTANWFHV